MYYMHTVHVMYIEAVVEYTNLNHQSRKQKVHKCGFCLIESSGFDLQWQGSQLNVMLAAFATDCQRTEFPSIRKEIRRIITGGKRNHRIQT